MTLTELLEDLATKSADVPLVFSTDAGEIGAGYHVTELKAAAIESIDCGGRSSEWTEVAMQLLDGKGDNHMPVGKFRGILEHSFDRIPELRDAPAHVEFAPQNRGLRRYEMSVRRASTDRAEIRLIEAQAVCKPYKAAMSGCGAGTACCG